MVAFTAAAGAQEPAGDVRKVTDPSGRQEVLYPTRRAELILGASKPKPIEPPVAIARGAAVLTKDANTHVRMRPDYPEAVLFANTLVQFDSLDQWLLRHGASFIANRRGKLAVVVEGLETILVGSEVYVEVTGNGLLVYVVEGRVVLGTTSAVVLTAGQAGRVAKGGMPRRIELSADESTRVDGQIQIARLMGVGSPSSDSKKIVVAVVGGGVAAAGAVVALSGSGGTTSLAPTTTTTTSTASSTTTSTTTSTTPAPTMPPTTQTTMTMPPSPGVTGIWTGNQSFIGERCTIQLVLTLDLIQTQATVTGNKTTRVTQCMDNGGCVGGCTVGSMETLPIQGSVNGSTIQFRAVKPPPPPRGCAEDYAGTIDKDTLTGMFTNSCDGGGSWTVFR